MLFAHLHWANRLVPLAAFACVGSCLHILNDGICQGKDGAELLHHTCFGFPSASCGWRDAGLALQPIVNAVGASPLAEAPRPPHRASGGHRFFDMNWRLDHQIENRLFSSDPTEPLKGTHSVNT